LPTVASDRQKNRVARFGHRTGVSLSVIVCCQLMMVLDAMIVNIALPGIQADLGFTFSGLSWVMNAYLLAFGGLLLLGGRAGDALGRRRIFIAGIVVFTVASLAGGFATSSWFLVAARAGQGLGAAMAAPSTMALIMSIYPEGPRRSRAIAVYSVVGGCGAALGLILGGVLTSAASWRWVLFVNVPVGLVLVLLAPLFISETRGARGRLDVTGAITSTVGMVAIVFGLVQASEAGWTSPVTLVSFAVGVALLGTFVVVEHRAEQPVLPLGLFRSRNRSGAYLGIVLVQGSMVGMLFYLTLFVQQVLGYSPIRAAVAFLPTAAVLIAVAGVVTQLIPKIGGRRVMIIGAVLVCAGNLWLSRLSVDSGYVDGLLGPLVVVGVGMAFATIAPTMFAVSGVATEQSGAASSLLNAVQQIGGSLGLAVLVTVFSATTGGNAQSVSPEQLVAGMSGVFIAAALFAVCTIAAAMILHPDRPSAAAGTPAVGSDPR
jgi:EmrB/QacA subfamily drug resistance transporter